MKVKYFNIVLNNINNKNVLKSFLEVGASHQKYKKSTKPYHRMGNCVACRET